PAPTRIPGGARPGAAFQPSGSTLQRLAAESFKRDQAAGNGVRNSDRFAAPTVSGLHRLKKSGRRVVETNSGGPRRHAARALGPQKHAVGTNSIGSNADE